VAGGNGSFIKGMDSNYMLLGIIVGLLARGVLVSIVPIAFGVAVLEVGGNSMQAVAQVPSEIVFIIEACILAVVVVIPVVRSYWAARRHA
jgi:simple sugar transport system permease protein